MESNMLKKMKQILVEIVTNCTEFPHIMTSATILLPPPLPAHIQQKKIHFLSISLIHFLYILFPSGNGLQGRIKWKKLSSQPILETVFEERQAYTVYCIFKTFYWQHDCEYQAISGGIPLVFMERVKNCDWCASLSKGAGQEIYFIREGS